MLSEVLICHLPKLIIILQGHGPCTFTVYLIDILDNGPFVNIFYKNLKTSARLLCYTDLVIDWPFYFSVAYNK